MDWEKPFFFVAFGAAAVLFVYYIGYPPEFATFSPIVSKLVPWLWGAAVLGGVYFPVRVYLSRRFGP